MGSFDYTCGVSGMPIRVGENVRYMLVTENPYAENRTAPITSMDVWFPRTEPKVRSISIERSTLATADDVDAWVERQKKTLVEAIKDGPVLVS